MTQLNLSATLPNPHKLDYDTQRRQIEHLVKGKIKSQIYDIMLAWPDTRPRAKHAYKMLYYRWTKLFGVFPERYMPTDKFNKWMSMPDEQSLARIKRFVLKAHPELLEGMRSEPQERAQLNEQASRDFYANENQGY